MEKSIFELSALDNYKKKWENVQSVLVGGCFDILHYGHLTFLKNAAQLGDALIIALESDEFIKTYKKRAPVHNQQQRAELLASLSIVDYVIKLPFMKGNDAYFSLVKEVAPSIIAITEGDAFYEIKKQQAETVGAHLIVAAPALSAFSTSSILAYETIFSG